MHMHAILILGSTLCTSFLAFSIASYRVIACTATYACYNINYTASQPKTPIPFQMVDSLPAMTSTFCNRVGGGVDWLAQTLLWNLWLVCWLCGAVWCCVVRVVCCCMINRLAYISEYASFDHLNSRSSFNSDEACSWRHSHGDSWNEVGGGLSRTRGRRVRRTLWMW